MKTTRANPAVTITGTVTRPTNTDAYASGDVLSNSTSAGTYLTFENAAATQGEGGCIKQILIVDSFNQPTKPTLALWLFDSPPNALNDNAAFAPTDAAIATMITRVNLGLLNVANPGVGTDGNAYALNATIQIPFQCAPDSRNIYGYLVHGATYTPGSAEVFNVRLAIEQH